jgi:hypothetical protein
MVSSDVVAYRDDRQALSLQLAELERENTRLREELDLLRESAKRQRDEDREERRRTGSGAACVVCGGSLLPVALFAGNNLRSPIPLSTSTMRFGDPDGGFTRSAPVKAKVCSSCGYVHCFIDIEKAEDADALDDPDI